MRSIWCLVVTVGLATAGCSSDSDNSSEPATTLGTSAGAVTAIDATVSPTVSPSVSTSVEATTDAAVAEPTAAPPPTSSAPSSTTATSAAITPEVLCVGSSRGNPVYFGYTNSSATPIAVEANDDNVLDGALDDDVPLVPIVFAAGRVSPAFWAFAAETAEAVDLAWTVRGPDGVARTAAPDPTTPECTDDLLLPPADDTRTPTLAFSYTALPEFSQPPQQIDFLATVVGVPPVSVCASGLEPQAAMTWTDDGNAGSETDGPTARRTLPFEQVTDPTTNETFLVARTTVSAFVVDVCGADGADGAVSKSWPIGGSFERLQTGVLVCFRVEDGRITMEVKDLSVPTTCVGVPLPATGGARIRSLP